ncbi:zinc ribbon domain-containing protein [Microbacterium sp.]|uniref:zinc ribbon domain-containing protein n=1 Tax=Microbacterium sp. TaxID=51671 RepID=UPI003A84C54C
MTRYDFRCAHGDLHERSFPMGQAPDAIEAECGSAARRVFAAPYLSGAVSGAFQAIETSMRSAYEPPVVTALPGAPRTPTPVSAEPRHARLPRP